MSKLEDLTGKKYNKLTVISRDMQNFDSRVRWICKCDCGNQVSVRANNLKNGQVKSCGCATRLVDLTGVRFGKLLVKERANNRLNSCNQQVVYWKCQCDCGTIKEISAQNLKSGTSTHCGCENNIDYSGEKFGEITVLRPYDKKVGSHKTWECECSCGNKMYITTYDIIAKKKKSCGCVNRIKYRTKCEEKVVGKKFGKLRVLESTDISKNGDILYKCQCDCGNIVLRKQRSLFDDVESSCEFCFKDNTRKAWEVLNEEERKEGTILFALNSKIRKDNKSGRKGVIWEKRRKKWMSFITLKGKRKHIGYFDNYEDAVAAREEAEKEYFEPVLERYGRSIEYHKFRKE